MEAFFSWFTSQSGVSLLVALVALVGVLVTTWWNNRAADKRRRADQAAADQRRKDDQAAEDARRKADDDRRERERREQLRREDWTRQRRAVADCISVVKEEFRECLMVCVWEPNPHKEMNQNDYYGETRSG